MENVIVKNEEYSVVSVCGTGKTSVAFEIVQKQIFESVDKSNDSDSEELGL
jgi:hypothetical protein